MVGVKGSLVNAGFPLTLIPTSSTKAESALTDKEPR